MKVGAMVLEGGYIKFQELRVVRNASDTPTEVSLRGNSFFGISSAGTGDSKG